MDKPCKNCGFNDFELVDGHYYCTECHEEVENVVDVEIEQFDNENIFYDTRGGLKQKTSSNNEQNKQSALESKCTSYEEYNFILRGLVDEILEIENIPNFKRTVLQLWITFLKYNEVAFFDDENLGHLPRLHAYYRKQDAEILYNKKYVKKKTKRQNKKPKVELKLEDDSKEARKLKRRSSKKSLKKIQKINEDSESAACSSNTSILTNLTLEEIEETMIGQELRIEFSNPAKKAKEEYLKFMKMRDLEVRVDEEGEFDPKMTNFTTQKYRLLFLTGRTLLFILYCALNICGSTIQLCDLLRFAREGHISFYNFRKLLPDKFEDTKLSLTENHGLSVLKYVSMAITLQSFLTNFPDFRKSFKSPNLLVLVRRYIDDLNLPSCLADYVEKLMELLPSSFESEKKNISNYEGRAMAYILFILKLIFGIDGYREKEISQSAKKLNLMFKDYGIGTTLFNYEKWRECIEYRETILNLYYYPPIFDVDNTIQKPYKSFVSMLDNVQPESFLTYKVDDKMTKTQKEQKQRNENAKNILLKLMNLHDESPMKELKFKASFTPLKDAIKVILESQFESTINRNILVDFSNTSLECYFDPENLVTMCSNHGLNISLKKSTFPKNYSFQPSGMKKLPPYREKLNISHDTISEYKWLKNVMKERKSHDEMEAKILAHEKTLSNVIEKRLNLRKLIALKNETLNLKEHAYDEIILCDVEDNDNSDVPTFVHSDYNFWHRFIRSSRYQCSNPGFDEDINNLPKNFLWLLKTASKTIYQEPGTVYSNLLLIEDALLNLFQPMELTDSQLKLKNKKSKFF